ncbi:uncharacterized protein LOC117121203 isoform X2 [Anneissia japonica]|uniref:uncharacterized protein LOC117121203 isoform X2 n=1 Tax=Anneissia japonica TaxID=1529436 RepID=UPI0014254C12|nr:uncharacterized protein LOC117121203 isoform X2 [Anneissia japonica]XP_033122211.1 uncharacterized protein LOC117121203 isoform X2 [Anneissia japonica]XP_033122213.1 uncharacterized protein LOC117121203 isoform X2 [Anneissia japonica]XP_033122214.1 uncharacterized protein LOC117121203 isoform X2 [Anneissia japonica]
MVEIITEFRPVAVFFLTEVTIECKIKGMAEHHVASWFHDEKAITFGEEVIKHEFNIILQCATDGIHTYTIKMDAEQPLEGMYTMKVYERGPNRNLDVVAQKDIACLEIKRRYEHEDIRFEFIGYTPPLWITGGGVSIEDKPFYGKRLCVLGLEIEIQAPWVKGVNEGHVVCWCLNGKVLTHGKDVVEESQKHRLVPQIKENGVHTLTIKKAQITDEGTYSFRVYEAGSELQNMLVTSDITNIKILY